MLYNYVNDNYFPEERTSWYDTCIEKEICLFPNAPNIRVITQISSEKYERKQCQSNMVFLPNSEEAKPLTLEYYGITYPFDLYNTRAIRKLLESVDSEHALVFVWDEVKEMYYTRGVDSLSAFESGDMSSESYIVKITNSMTWLISVCGIPLLGYKNGNYVTSNDIQQDSEEKINSIINKIAKLAQKNSIHQYDENVWHDICSDIINAGHGTSFVLYVDSNEAKKEAERLSKYKRGIMPKKPQNFFESLIRNEYLKQNIAIDGGLVFDISGRCYAYGCIFDGTLPEIFDAQPSQFEGMSSRGSRFNSMLLYIYLKNHSSDCKDFYEKCLGVVFSDDYSVDSITGDENSLCVSKT